MKKYLLALLFVLWTSAALAAPSLTINQVDTSLCQTVKVVVTATNNGVAIDNLTAANFSISDNNVAQTITSIRSTEGGSQAVSLGMTLDYSGSMSSTDVYNMEAAAKQFVNSMQFGDSAAIIKFSTDVVTTQHFTTDKAALIYAIENGDPSRSMTSFYDGTYEAISQTANQYGRRAVIAMTDGSDNDSSRTYTQVVNHANANNIPIYTIGFGSPDANTLQQMATATGGKYFYAPNSSELQDVYDEIAQELQDQYVLQFNPTTNDGQDHTLRIDLSHSTGSAYATKSYGSCPDYEAPDTPIETGMTGTVRSLEGVPLSGARVTLSGQSATTNDDGKYTLSSISAGTQSVQVSMSGYNTLTESVTATEGSCLNKNFRLTPVETGGKPTVLSLSPRYSGFFLDTLDLDNVIAASVLWNGNPGTVTFTINDRRVYTESGTLSGASHIFNMGSDFFPSIGLNNNRIKVVATNAEGYDSDPRYFDLTVLPIPSWSLEFGFSPFTVKIEPGSVTFSRGWSFPDDPFSGKIYIPSIFPFIGGHDIGLKETQASLGISLKNDGTGEVGVGGQTGFTACGRDLTGSISGSGALEVTNNGLEWKKTSLGVNVGGTIGPDPIGIVELIPALASLSNLPGISWFNKKAQVTCDVSPDVGLGLNLVHDNGSVNFESSEGSGKVGLELGMELKIMKSLETRLYGGGEPSLTFQFPKNPGYLKKLAAKLYAGITLKAWLLEANKEKAFEWNWSAAAAREFARELYAVRQSADDMSDGFEPVPPRFLKYGPKRQPGTQFRSIAPLLSSRAAGGATTTELMVESNVYEYSGPQVAENGGNIAMVFVDYDVDDPQLQNTEIAFTLYESGAFTPYVWISDDTRAEFNPQVAFDVNGNVVAVWERIKSTNFTSTDLEAAAAQMEIVYAVFNMTTKTWSTPVALTNNDYLDHDPMLKRAPDGSLLLVWSTNAGNKLVPTATDRGWGISRKWNGTTWSAAQVARWNAANAFDFDLAYWGTGGILVWTQDMDNNLATLADQEIYYATYANGAWSREARLTNDSVADSSPKVVVSSTGDMYMAWLHGNQLVKLDNLGAGTFSTIKDNCDEFGFTGFKLAVNTQDNLVLAWAQQDAGGNDIFYTIYDAVHNCWSVGTRLTKDASVEKYFMPFFPSDDKIITAYNKVNVEKVTRNVSIEGQNVAIDNVASPGRNDLYFLSYDITNEFAAESISITPQALVAGETATIQVGVANQGDMGVTNLAVSFYDGDPNNGGVLISTQTNSSVIKPGETATFTTTWTVPGDGAVHVIYAVVDPQNTYPERNETNNTITKTVLLPDAKFLQGQSEWLNSTAVQVVAQVTNDGTVSMQNLVVAFYSDREKTAKVAERTIATLAPGATADVDLVWNLSPQTLVNGYATLYVQLDPAGLISELTEANNAGVVQVLAKDSDRDGLNDFDEVVAGSDSSNPDSDSDGIPDGWEVANGLNPMDAADATSDTDNDGLTALEEYQNNCNPQLDDTDSDGMPDGWEVDNNLLPTVNDAGDDPDNDGATNLEEYINGTDPNDSAINLASIYGLLLFGDDGLQDTDYFPLHSTEYQYVETGSGTTANIRFVSPNLPIQYPVSGILRHGGTYGGQTITSGGLFKHANGVLYKYGHVWSSGMFSKLDSPLPIGNAFVVGKTTTMQSARTEYASNGSVLGRGSDSLTISTSGPVPVTVPAGTYSAYLVTVTDRWTSHTGSSGTTLEEYWLVKDVGIVRMRFDGAQDFRLNVNPALSR